MIWPQRRSHSLAGCCLAPITGVASPQTASPPELSSTWVSANLPAHFIGNRGQWPAPTKFAVGKASLAASFEYDAIRRRLGTEKAALVFEDTSPRVILAGKGKRRGHY